MKPTQKQKENKAAIIEDMLSCIRYTPNREADILAFIEQYQKADGEHRPSILECLRSCMDGGEYPNPYEGSYRYTAEDVADFEKILDDYTEKVFEAEYDPADSARCVQEVFSKIDRLNEQCGHALIDTWRRERVCGFINSIAANVEMAQKSDCCLQQKMG